MQLGGELKIDYSKYENYFADTEEYKNLENEFNSITSKEVKNTYQEEIEKQIKKDLEKNIRLNVEDISVEIDKETYEILNITICIGEEKESNILIDKVKIGDTINKNTVSKENIDRIKEFLKENYNISDEIITVNSI